MKILSIDTSSKNCSISIVEANNSTFNIIAVKNNSDEKTHSQKLMPLIDEMFKEVNFSLDNIDLLACCVGPGSFTGIRIGVATVKAFADVKGIPVVGVTSLESLAYNIEENGYIIPIIDAKNNNLYSAIFSNKNYIYSTEIKDFADNIDNALNIYNNFLASSQENIYFVGDGSIAYKDIIINNFQNKNIHFPTQNLQSSISLARCAYSKYLNGFYGDSNSISPIYLRKSQAERNLDGEK